MSAFDPCTKRCHFNDSDERHSTTVRNVQWKKFFQKKIKDFTVKKSADLCVFWSYTFNMNSKIYHLAALPTVLLEHKIKNIKDAKKKTVLQHLKD